MAKQKSKTDEALIWGSILITLGAIFLLQKVFNIEILSQVWQFWPIALIIWGAVIIAKRRG